MRARARGRFVLGCLGALVLVAGCGGSSAQTSEGSQATGGGEGEAGADPGGAPARTTAVEVGSPGPPPPQQQTTADPMLTLQGSFDELGDVSRELEEALASPDCGLARDLRDRICDLSSRICAIAEEHPQETEAGDRCEDGRGRCERASRDIEGSCEG